MKAGSVLFFSLPRHDGEYNSTPWQIASRLASGRQVFFADHPFTFIEALRYFWRPDIRTRWKAWTGRATRQVGDVTVILLPFIWPVNFLPKGRLYRFFATWNHSIIARRINSVLKNEGVSSVIYVNSFEFYFPEIDQFLSVSTDLKVYHCIDPMVKSFTIKHGIYLEQELVRRSDLVISTAPSLQRKFETTGIRKSYLVANGVDATHFNQAMRLSEVSPLVKSIQGKVVGYIGNIERRIDYVLLLEVLDRLTDWHLVMAGPVEKNYVPDALLHHPRVTFTGAIAYAEAPAVVKRFDVAIIPFQCDDVSAGIYPLKMFEYLAAGKPVVSTHFNDEILQPLARFVDCASGADSFAKEIAKAYATDTAFLAHARVAVAFENTWDERTIHFEAILNEELAQHKSHVT